MILAAAFIAVRISDVQLPPSSFPAAIPRRPCLISGAVNAAQKLHLLARYLPAMPRDAMLGRLENIR
jgi:hypothetical protein